MIHPGAAAARHLLLGLTALCAPLAVAQMQLQPEIVIAAGGGANSSVSYGGLATSAELNNPEGVAFDSAGNIYIADSSNCVIRKVTVATGDISLFAGDGSCGYGGDGAAAKSAELANPGRIAFDSSGNLYIGDTGNARIRKVNTSGDISTVAGDGQVGSTGDGGAATSSELNSPIGVALDSSGNVYIADSGNNKIRKVTVSTGKISTLAGTGTAGYNGEGTATSAELYGPTDVAVDRSGNVYIADKGNNRIRKVSGTTISTVVGNESQGYSGDGGAATSAELSNPNGFTLDSAGNYYVADTGNNRIRKVNAGTLIISTLTGNGTAADTGNNGPAVSAEINQPRGLGVNSANDLYIADTGNNLVREVVQNTYFATTAVGGSSAVQDFFLKTTAAETIASITAQESQGSKQEYSIGTITGCTIAGASNPSGTFCTVPITFKPAYPGARYVPLTAVTGTGKVTFGLGGTGSGPLVTMSPGTIATAAGNGTAGYSGNGSAATTAKLSSPNAAVVDSAGNLYIADMSNNVVREVAASTGDISTVAGNHTAGYSGDGSAATSAELDEPSGVGVDSGGNLYIADKVNCRIRKVTVATANISAAAGNGTCGYGGDGGPATSAEIKAPSSDIAFDNAGNWYFADSGNNRVREVNASSGLISTVAGNGTAGYTGDGSAATSAELDNPAGVALDSAGNLYIADDGNNVIRKVTVSTGNIATVAGDHTAGYSGDGSAATSAELDEPGGVAVDAATNLYIADQGNNRIRVVNAVSGKISTIAGNGTAGYSGDSGAATSAELKGPTDISLDSAGNLVIADAGNNVVRKVTAGGAQLTFPTATSIGNTDAADDPLTATVVNIGNASLTISTPSSGTNPSVGNYFALDATTTCPELTTASSPKTLTSGEDCTYAVDFAPSVVGNIGGSVVLTNDSLNAIGSTQTVNLTATAIGVETTTTVSSPANPSTYLGSVTFTATVEQVTGSNVPTGTVQFNIDGVNAGSAVTLNGGGVATYATAALTAGMHSIQAVYSPSTSNFLASTSSVFSQTVNKATPTVPWATPAPITYGTALSATQLDATSGGVAGSYVYSPISGTVLTAGSQTLSVTFTPADTTDYNTSTGSVTLTVNKATPALSVATSGSPSTYGGSVTFTATVSSGPYVTVTFFESGNAIGTGTISGTTATITTNTLTAGSHSITAGLASSTNYNAVTSSAITQTVNKATPSIVWTNPSPVTYGTALSSTQLDASSGGVAGAFVYTPTAGAVLSVGSQTLSVTFNPTDTSDYNSTSAWVTLTVDNKITPTITWSTPTPITYGTALSTTQLNASSGGVAGIMTYSPAAGTVLASGTQTLSVTFTPTDTTDYNPVLQTVSLTVNKGSVAINGTSSLSVSLYGDNVTATFTFTGAGVTPAGTTTIMDGAVTLATVPLNAGVATYSSSALFAGSHTLKAVYNGDDNYE
jgi:sugar lactone lactonase YvrE